MSKEESGGAAFQAPTAGVAPLLRSAQLAHAELVAEARTLGIPAHALPPLPAEASLAAVDAAVNHLQLMIASRLSSNL